jgi:putative transposase
VVCVEDLNVKGMSKNHCLARSVLNQSFGKMVELLGYKAQVLLKVPRFFPSSQLCPVCGEQQKMKLNKRTYSCPCGYEQDRDFNGSLNILLKAIEEFKLVDRKALALLQDKVKLCLEEARISKVILTEEFLCSSTF